MTVEMNKKLDPIRDHHVQKFSFEKDDNRLVIKYDGQFFAIFPIVYGMPKGFPDRAISMFIEMILGQRTELWDKQALHGDNVWPSREEILAQFEKEYQNA